MRGIGEGVAVDRYVFEFRFIFVDRGCIALLEDALKADDTFQYARGMLHFERALQLAPLEKDERQKEAFERGDSLQSPLVAFYKDRNQIKAFIYVAKYVHCLVRDSRPKIPVCQELVALFLEHEGGINKLSFFVSNFLRHFEILECDAARRAFAFISKYLSRAITNRKVIGASSPLQPPPQKSAFSRRAKEWDGLQGAYVFFDAMLAYVHYMQRAYMCSEVGIRIGDSFSKLCDLCLSASKRGGTDGFQPIQSHFESWAMENVETAAVVHFKYSRFGYKLLHILLVKRCMTKQRIDRKMPVNLVFVARPEEELVLPSARKEPNFIPYFERDSDYARYMLKKHKIGPQEED